MSEPTKTVYHYTDQKGKEAIEKTGEIKPSKGGIAGEGVYVTTMSPSEGRKAVSENNWPGGANAQESKGKADHAIKVQIPVSELTKPKEAKGRDVLVHDGPVKLDDHKWKSMSK
eukprot:TRINITY_DN17038_c1_g2_i5.p1 TRINITY_DN17038_c1_g2~~TRINITY_DN17038_c1_g2_i5.p1  ORF type:complete len:114 (+),score=27.05 TRINITY_DN17038_c1_g2_i5:129-470(+)